MLCYCLWPVRNFYTDICVKMKVASHSRNKSIYYVPFV